MKQVNEVVQELYAAGLTVSENNIVCKSDAKTVSKEQEEYPGAVVVFQKKKGKPTKKVTAFAITHDGHISKLVYAIMTTDTDFRELIRKVLTTKKKE